LLFVVSVNSRVDQIALKKEEKSFNKIQLNKHISLHFTRFKNFDEEFFLPPSSSLKSTCELDRVSDARRVFVLPVVEAEG
jgi:hypothetical protein